MGKRRVRRYTQAFRKMVVGQVKQCDNIVALSKELGLSRRLMYTWRDQIDAAEMGESLPENSRESTLRKEVRQLKRVLADKTVEADFFEGALRKVGARRRRSSRSGEKASTTKSGK